VRAIAQRMAIALAVRPSLAHAVGTVMDPSGQGGRLQKAPKAAATQVAAAKR
jgi:hypothetical protein